MAGIMLLDDVNKAFAAGDVDSLADRIIEKIVRKTVYRNFRDRLARKGIQDYQPRRPARADKQATVRFIQRHGRVALNVLEPPRVEQRPPVAVYYRDLFQAGHIRKNPFSFLLDRYPLGLTRQRDFPQEFSFRNSDDGDAGLAGTHAAYVKLSCTRVVLQFVQDALEINTGNQLKCLAVVNVYALAARDVELIELGSESGGCRPFPRQAAPHMAGAKVYNFENMVGGRRSEQPLMFGIHRHVVEAALNVGQSDRPRQNQGVRFLRLHGQGNTEGGGQEHDGLDLHANLIIESTENTFPSPCHGPD